MTERAAWKPPAVVAVTGAAGKTGRAVVDALRRRGVRLRLLARSAEQAASLAGAGGAGADVTQGDLRDMVALRALLAGADAVYHICPNMAPDEEAIGERLIAAAQAESERSARPVHVVYHSVLHPQTPDMPHHWNKMLVEGRLWRCGLPVTILQPAAYMQNVLAGRQRIVQEGVYAVPYAPSTRITMVNLDEVAAAAAEVLVSSSHQNATYELAAGEALSQTEVADALSDALGRRVRVEETPRSIWQTAAAAAGMGVYAIGTLLKMFEYYEAHGFRGGSAALCMLLGREPQQFAAWVHMVDWEQTDTTAITATS